MDTRLTQPHLADPEVETVQARIEHSRRDLSETIEALVYKTDIPARTSDAIAEGIATAKDTVAVVFNEAAAQVPMSTRR